MVYVQDVERDAESSASSHRIDDVGTRTSTNPTCQPDEEPKGTCHPDDSVSHRPHIPFFRQTIPSDNLLIPLLIVTLTTGLLDASTFSSFNVFASNQTGNAILLTLAAANAAPVELHNTAASLGGFLFCGLVAGKLGNWMGNRNRGWLLMSNLVQLVILLLVTILSSPSIHILESTHRASQWITLLLLASSAGFQVAMAKTSGVQEVPTAMLTSPFIEFATDKALYKKWTAGGCVKSRNRRAIYITCLMGGSLIGAYMHRYTGGATSVLILATCLKALTTVQMAVLPGEDTV
ncbi:DUF1275 domain protein [Filobasidium floriforme]|uniref:DUF1275 domain protein n=1 Tax=Filobasidium floriforme TaxID=5210 RepID=UPI001E8EBE85|nr:DUF1275 domain protein [Filobasidium floriforme]KAH8078334.1 DUF1275 domain protein [Filobasidium floriforme]